MSSARSETSTVLMIGTSPDTQGGVSSVVREMLGSPLASAYRIRYVSTHCDGGLGRKLVASVRGIFSTWCGLILRRPGLLHVHLASRASFWRKLAAVSPAWMLRIPVLVHLHGAEFRDFQEKESGPLGRFFIRQMLERSCRVVALSEGWREWLDKQFPVAQTQVIPNSVRLPEQARAVTSPSPTLLFMGRLGKRKGTHDLIRAFATLAALSPPPKLILAGDGDIAGARLLAEELGISQLVDTPGWVGPDAKARLLQEATAYVLPSYNEGLPMSVLEAMAHGLPVVSTPVGGIPDAITDGEDGFLVSPGDIEALSSRLRMLLSDPELAGRIGDAAREKVRTRFATSAVIERWLRLYAELMPFATSRTGAA
ncbi:glycosyltransferase family 4 protein [Lysobacter arenosi]|uniref:Glycosyltransferase family 4 protein n=1 Tax=Lysobacter arenosi TaxID=2795387 RepID=A0ABX7RD15_9GAMM|nr:glycosyltransferase family 4 protein [Lysobacter arenosi]QSX76044.1 glycosyltransferase family 4 protein [Lysobacter arenosi]